MIDQKITLGSQQGLDCLCNTVTIGAWESGSHAVFEIFPATCYKTIKLSVYLTSLCKTIKLSVYFTSLCFWMHINLMEIIPMCSVEQR